MDINSNDALSMEYSCGKQQLAQLNNALIQAYRTFNSASDSVVMESCISEINTIRQQRNTLLRQLRQIEPERKESIWNSYQASS